MGDFDGHPFRGNQWTTGAGVSVNPKEVDAMSLADNRDMMAGMVSRYREDPSFKGAADVLNEYSRLSQNEGLAVRAIVERALSGETAEQIAADPKVQKLLAEVADKFKDDAGGAKGYVEKLVGAAPGYYETLRGAVPTTETVWRGANRAPKGDEFDLKGPTAFSHSFDSAMTYAGGTIYKVEPGASMLPTGALSTAATAAKAGGEEERYATVPTFYESSDRSVDPRGMGYGFALKRDTDRELTSSGRFRVLKVKWDRISYRDTKTGNHRFKSVKIITVQQTGTF